MLLFAFLLMIVSGTVKSISCPHNYYRISETTCFHLAQPQAGDGARDFYCNNEGGGKYLSQPIPEEYFDGLLNMLVESAEKWMPDGAYLGMQRKGAENPFGPKETVWGFYGNEEIEEEDYELWFSPPNDKESCATIEKESDFLASPKECSYSSALLCEKNQPPCYLKELNYMDYAGRCLTVMKDLKAYDMARASCKEGHLFPMKTKEDHKSAKLAFYNSQTSGGVFLGLVKEDSAKWLYENGEEEPAMEEIDIEENHNCGVLRVKEDTKYLNFTGVECDFERLWFLCVISSEMSTNDDGNETSTTEKVSETSTTEEASEPSTTEEESETSTTEEASETSTTEKVSETSTTEEANEITTTDDGSEESTIEETSQGTTTEDANEKSTTAEMGEVSTSDDEGFLINIIPDSL